MADIGIRVEADVDPARKKLEELGAEFKKLGEASRAPVSSLEDLDKALAATLELGRKGAISMQEAERRASALGNQYKNLTDVVDKTNIKFGELGKEALRAASDAVGLGGLRRSAESAKDSLDSAGASVSWLAVGLGTGLVVAAGAAIAKLAGAVSETAALGEKLNNLSQITGFSVEKLSGLKLAAEVSGTSLEGLAQGVTQFNRRFDEAQKGTGAAAEAFRRLGIEVKGISEQQAWDLFIRKMSAMEDGAEKIGIGTDVMGRSFRSLVPLINEGAEGFAKLEREAKQAGITMSTETARAANELNANMAVLKAYGQGFWVEIASPIVEGLARITRAMRDARNEGSGLLGSLWAGVVRGTAEVFGGSARGNLDENRASEARLIKAINEQEAKKLLPGFRSSIVFEQNLRAQYSALQGIYAQRGRLEELYELEQPGFFGAGRKETPPQRAPTASRGGGRTEREASMESIFAADERFKLNLLKLGQTDEGELAEFYAAWAERASGNEQLQASILAKHADHVKRVLAEETRDREKKEREEERLIGMVEKAEQRSYDQGHVALRKRQDEVAKQAQDEIQIIRETVFLTRDERVAALKALSEKYAEYGIQGVKAEETIQKALRHTKTDAQAFSEELSKIFAYSIPREVLKTVDVIDRSLGHAIYGFVSGMKSLGDSLKSFFAGVAQSILQTLSQIAAHEIMKGAFGVSLGTGASIFSGAATGAVTATGGDGGLLSSAGSLLGNLFGGGAAGGGLATGASAATSLAMAEAGIGTGSIGLLSAVPGWGWAIGGGVLLGSALGLFGGDGGPKDPDLGIVRRSNGDIGLEANNFSSPMPVSWYEAQDVWLNSLPATTKSTLIGQRVSGNPSSGVRELFAQLVGPYLDGHMFASGTDMIVTRPTVFAAGEVGAERVQVTPLAGTVRSSGGITINGPAMFDEYTFRRFRRMMTE